MHMPSCTCAGQAVRTFTAVRPQRQNDVYKFHIKTDSRWFAGDRRDLQRLRQADARHAIQEWSSEFGQAAGKPFGHAADFTRALSLESA